MAGGIGPEPGARGHGWLGLYGPHLGLRLGAALGACGLLVHYFDYAPQILVTHGLLVLVGALGELWLLAALTALPGLGARTRAALPVVPLLGSLFLLLLYAADGLTNAMFGQNVSAAFLGRYLPHLGEVAGALPAAVVPGCAAALLALGLALGHLHGRTVRALAARRPAGVGAHALAGATLAALALLLAAGMTRHARPQDHAWWRGEPLTNLVWLERFDAFAADPRRRSLERREARVAEAYPTGAPARPRNVVLILVDSLRADHLPMYGYERDTAPFLRQLYERGALQKVEHAYSTCSESFCGILSALSSKEYRSLTRRDFRLPDALARQGYRNAFFLAGDHEWFGLKDAYGERVHVLRDATVDPRFGVLDDRLVLEGLEELGAYDGTPTFLYFFLMSAHFLAPRKEGFQVWQPAPPSVQWGEYTRGGYDRDAVRNRYDNGVRQADDMIARIFEALERKGYLRDSLVIVSADHGDGLGEKGFFGHTYHLFEEDIRVPLLVGAPDGRRLAQTRYATHVDLAPSVLDWLGAPIPETWQGYSLFAPPTRRESRHETPRRGGCRALIEQRAEGLTKYLRCETEVPGRGREMLYALGADPNEAANLVDSVSERELARLRARLNAEPVPPVSALGP